MQITLDTQGLAPQIAPSPKEMMSVVVTPEGQTRVRVNSSSLSIMQECWRKTDYSLVRGLKSNLESPATLFGTATHKGLEVFYLGKRKERKIPARNYETTLQMIGCGTWDPDWEEYLVFRAARAFTEKAQPLRGIPDGNKRSIGTGIWMLEHYFRQYIDDPFTVMELNGEPLVEYKFTLPIYESADLYIETFGQIDVVLKNEVTGVILPGDHKTTSILGQQFYQRLNPNHQYTFYTWACNDVLKLETESFLVNALQVKEPPKTSRGSPPQFARQVTTRTREDFEDLRLTIIDSVKTFLEKKKNNFFPMSTPGPCANYGGCQYIDVCGAPKSLRENIISAKYQQIGGMNATQ